MYGRELQTGPAIWAVSQFRFLNRRDVEVQRINNPLRLRVSAVTLAQTESLLNLQSK